MYSQVVDPDHKNWQVDWEDPEHDYEYRVDIVIEVEMNIRTLRRCQLLSLHRREYVVSGPTHCLLGIM